MPETERRFTGNDLSGIEVREAEGDEPQKIVGYAAVFYDGTEATEYKMSWGGTERIAKTAFKRALREKQDVRGLFNHNPDNLLGRTTAATMTLKTDDRGLRFEIPVTDTTVSRDVAANIASGNLTGASFSFQIRESGEKWKKDGEDHIRTLVDVDLFDVGPVTFPAYGATEVSVRWKQQLSAAATFERSQRARRCRARALAIRAMEIA